MTLNPAVHMQEWSRARPVPGSPLYGLSLVATQGQRRIIDELTSSRKLEVLELADGLELRASAWVGRVDLGGTTVTIKPKITGAPLLRLLRYAYNLRNLDLFGTAQYAALDRSFQDLIIRQLAAEAAELISRGLHREYRRERETLASPRGQIDFQSYLALRGTAQAALPCIYYPRTEETLLNQVLLAGLRLAARASTDVELRSRVRRLARELDSYVSEITLDLTTLQQAWWTIDRRTRSYEPTLTLVGLLVESEGISLDDQPEMLRLPGFLFDMNRFFQSLISRLLKEHLKGYVVQDEHRLKGMFSYDPAHNPRGRRAPIQRPDFAIVQAGMTIEVLDAKYRDLWEKRLPTDMLYQLALYALGRHGTERRSTILYPTMNTGANDQIIVVQEPMFGSPEARVTLRPVKLLELDSLLLAPSDRCGTKKRTEYAHQLVFGKKNDPWPE